MTKTICDICGDEMLPSKNVDTIENLNFCISSHGRIWDICDECRVSLNKWMTMRKQKDELLEEDKTLIPYSYNVAIEYLRSQGKLKGDNNG